MNATAGTEGGRWVERFLLPIVADRLEGAPRTTPHRCLQIAPANEEEAAHLRALGWTCDVVVPPEREDEESAWRQPPLRQPLHELHPPNAPYDLVLTGALGLVLGDEAHCRTSIDHLGRACRPGGGLLVVTGNRRCPLDLTGNAARLHGPAVATLPTMASLHRDFVADGPFSSLHPFPVRGHFGSTGNGVLMRVLRGLLDWNWRHFAVPRRPRAYAGPLNPTLVIWIRK